MLGHQAPERTRAPGLCGNSAFSSSPEERPFPWRKEESFGSLCGWAWSPDEAPWAPWLSQNERYVPWTKAQASVFSWGP